ncbi:hypothetical protein [Ruminococcus sp. FC2018]|uniref:hypothetical protein n=1 Tax=Ruminococcus sp. FC2018 TaxID=1410617 RepID=UPI00048F8A5D|nr:hypothetical protein [Ruminococcus sp. FC2018]
MAAPAEPFGAAVMTYTIQALAQAGMIHATVRLYIRKNTLTTLLQTLTMHLHRSDKNGGIYYG